LIGREATSCHNHIFLACPENFLANRSSTDAWFPHVDPQVDCGQHLVGLPVERGAGLFLRKAAGKNNHIAAPNEDDETGVNFEVEGGIY
jgi:hypothetical protein